MYAISGMEVVFKIGDNEINNQFMGSLRNEEKGAVLDLAVFTDETGYTYILPTFTSNLKHAWGLYSQIDYK